MDLIHPVTLEPCQFLSPKAGWLMKGVSNEAFFWIAANGKSKDQINVKKIMPIPV